MSFTAEILEVRNEGQGHRVRYQFSDGANVQGPFVADRPADEDHQAWADAIAPAPAVDYRDALIVQLGQERFDALATALADEGVEIVQMGPAMLPVTAAQQTPDDIQARVGARIDSSLGSGTFDSIKQTLKAMGFSEAALQYAGETVTL